VINYDTKLKYNLIINVVRPTYDDVDKLQVKAILVYIELFESGWTFVYVLQPRHSITQIKLVLIKFNSIHSICT